MHKVRKDRFAARELPDPELQHGKRGVADEPGPHRALAKHVLPAAIALRGQGALVERFDIEPLSDFSVK